MTEQVPKAIKKRLRALLRRVRRMQAARGVLGVATVALAGLLAVMAADFFLAPLPAVARWVLFVVLVAAVGMAAYSWLWKPLAHRISLVQIARWLELRHPEIQERISTAVELAGHEGGASEELLHELIVAAEDDVGTVDPQVEVRSRRVKKWMYPATGLAVVMALLFVIWPGETGRLFVRAVAPFSEIGNAGAVRFEIAPGDLEVMEGDEVEITIKYDGPKASALTLVVGRDGAEVLEETLAVAKMEDGTSEFVYRLPAAKKSFTYHARVRKAQSDPHRVTVYPLPRIEAVTVDYHYPPYTDRAPQQRELQRAVEALAGTEVRLSGVPNTPVETGKFLVDGKEMGTVTIEPGAAGGRVEVEWRLLPEESGLGQVMLVHRLGREVEGLRFPVKVKKDAPPKVELLAPMQREMKVRPDELITMQYAVEEDVDLAAVAIELRVNGKSVPSLPEVLPERDHTAKKKLWRGEALVYVGSLLDEFEKARDVKMRLAVTDVLPAELEGPGVGYSEWLEVRIDRNAESLVRQEFRAQQSDARETIEKAMREIAQAKQKMDGNRANVKKEELPKHTEKHFEQAREQLAETEEALEKLAERMERGVQAAKADEVREAAGETKEAREHLENTPLQDTPEGRQAELDEGRQAAQEAMETLQELRDQINRDEQKLEELARLSELAQQERELARQADRRSEEEGAEAQADRELQQQQRQIQQQIEQQMRQDPEAAAEMLERQAERARELAERAKELSERQEGLGEEMKEQARDAEHQKQQNGQERNREAGQEQAAEAEERMAEALQEQLQREQEKIVREAKAQMAEARQKREERADLLPEAVGEAQEALEAMREEQPQAAAEAAQAAAEMLEELAQSSEERSSSEEAGKNREGEMPREPGEKPGQESGEGNEEGKMAQETPGEQPGQESGEGNEKGQTTPESPGEKPGQESGEGNEEGKMAQETPGELPGQESGEGKERGQSAPESPGEKPGQESGEGNEEGKMAQEAPGEQPGQESGEPGGSESGEGKEGEMAQESSGEQPVQDGGEPGGDEADSALAELAARQEAVAEALEALGAGETGEAMQAVQEMQAQDAAELADAIEELPQMNGQSGHMAQATGQAQQGEQAAQQAAQKSQQGTPQGAAQQHAQASEAFEQAAQALQRAAAEFAKGAEQAAGREQNPNKLPLPAEAMADALEAAAEASQAESAGEAAQAAQAAAQALSQAAQQAMQGMKSGRQPGQPGQPGQQGQPGEMPGDDPQEGFRPEQGDPGVPPELAKLGISAKDWEKLQDLLRSDVGGAGGADIPEDYRTLVRQYFEQVAKGTKR